MSKKIAVASILCLAFGTVSIPSGILINNYIEDLTYDSIDEGLLGIREQSEPIGYAMVVHTFVAFLIDTTLNDLEMDFAGFHIEEPAATSEEFFNDEDYDFFVDLTILGLAHVSVFSVDGIAMYLNKGDLSFTPLAQERILLGNTELPGLITDLRHGDGVRDFLALYDRATTDALKADLSAKYDCTVDQLDDVVIYIRSYLIEEMIPLLLDGIDLQIDILGIDIPMWLIELLSPLLALIMGSEIPTHVDIIPLFMPELIGLNTIEEIAEFKFYEQWANGTVFDYPGYPLPLKGGIRYGYEVGLPVATGMNMDQILALWDEESEYSLVTKSGVKKWLALVSDPSSPLYDELKANNNDLTDHAMACLIEWLPRFQHDLMPYLAEHEYNLPTDSITLANMIEIGMVATGGALIGLGSTGLVSNRIVKIRAKKKTLAAKKGMLVKPDKLRKVDAGKISPENVGLKEKVSDLGLLEEESK